MGSYIKENSSHINLIIYNIRNHAPGIPRTTDPEQEDVFHIILYGRMA